MPNDNGPTPDAPDPRAPKFDKSTKRPLGDPQAADDTQSWWRTLNTSALATPIPFTGTSVQGFFDTQNDNLKRIVQNERDNAHPVRAGLAEFYYQVQKGLTDLASGILTPSNVALATASGGESVAAQTLKAASGLYFGYKGSQEIVSSKLPDESTGDMIRRKVTGAIQAVSGAEGAETGTVGAVEAGRAYIQNSMGIGGDLSGQIQAKVDKVNEIQADAAKKQDVIEKAVGGASNKVSATMDSRIAAIQETAKSQIDALKSPTDAQIKEINDSAKTQIDAVKTVGESVTASAAQAIPTNLNQIKTIASQVIAQKRGEFDSQYNALNEKATAPVTTVNDLKSEIVNSIKSEGVQDSEISKVTSKIFAALPSPEASTMLEPTAAVQKASQLAAQLNKQGLDPASIRSGLANLGYVKPQIQMAMAMTFPDLPKGSSDVSYEMTRRVKTDLFEAAQSAKDVDMKRGLEGAIENVKGIRQRYADDMGFGKEHKSVDAGYMKFMRDIGSGTMSDFLKAKDFEDQNTVLLQAQHLINQDSGEALRGLMSLAGVDTSHLKAALENKDAFSDLPQQAIPDIQKYAGKQIKELEAQHAAAVKQIQGQSDSQIKALGQTRDQILTSLENKKQQAILNLGKQMRESTQTVGETNPVIPGGNDLDLAGKNSLQIRLDALKALGDNAKKSGITDPFAFTQIMYGTAQLGFGSLFGTLHIARGLAPTGIRNMLRSEGFQNFVAKEAGVTPEAMPRFREMISKSEPYLKKMAVSTAVAAGAGDAIKKNQQPQPNSPPQGGPSPSSGQIAIAQ